jgi:hypothetical protein
MQDPSLVGDPDQPHRHSTLAMAWLKMLIDTAVKRGAAPCAWLGPPKAAIRAAGARGLGPRAAQGDVAATRVTVLEARPPDFGSSLRRISQLSDH